MKIKIMKKNLCCENLDNTYCLPRCPVAEATGNKKYWAKALQKHWAKALLISSLVSSRGDNSSAFLNVGTTTKRMEQQNNTILGNENTKKISLR
jgi:hypothetical protein